MITTKATLLCIVYKFHKHILHRFGGADSGPTAGMEIELFILMALPIGNVLSGLGHSSQLVTV